MNHSGLLRFEEEEKLPQTVERPKLRKISKIFTEEVKAVCASLSSKCSISAEKARGAVKTVCKEMYQHQYYLNADEYKNSEEMIQTNLEPPSKVPKTYKDYNDLYKYVLPSSGTILKYKYLQATQEQTDAGVALFNNTKPSKVTLHYDTTSRSNNDGEWPSLIRCLLIHSRLKATKIIGQRNAFYRKRIPGSSRARKETVDIDILVKSR